MATEKTETHNQGSRSPIREPLFGLSKVTASASLCSPRETVKK